MAARSADPSGPQVRFATLRYVLTRLVAKAVTYSVVRVRVEGRERIPAGRPVVYCANHLNWADPFVVLAVLPWRPWPYLFGPVEADMRRGLRNRIIAATGLAIPYRPGKENLLEATRRASAILRSGHALVIFGEGRIHAGERELLPLSEGPAYFALRTGVPIVPLAINGTSWLGFGRRVRVRFGTPIEPAGRPSREAVAALTATLETALRRLVADFPDPPPPGRFGRWLTELFNEWPEGRRPEPPAQPVEPPAPG